MTCDFCAGACVTTVPLALCRTHVIEFYQGLVATLARPCVADGPHLTPIEALRYTCASGRQPSLTVQGWQARGWRTEARRTSAWEVRGQCHRGHRRIAA